MKNQGMQVTIMGKHDETRTHKVVEWHGKKDIRVNPSYPLPLVTDPVLPRLLCHPADWRRAYALCSS